MASHFAPTCTFESRWELNRGDGNNDYYVRLFQSVCSRVLPTFIAACLLMHDRVCVSVCVWCTSLLSSLILNLKAKHSEAESAKRLRMAFYSQRKAPFGGNSSHLEWNCAAVMMVAMVMVLLLSQRFQRNGKYYAQTKRTNKAISY